MKKIVNILVKAVVMIIIFIVSVLFFNKFENREYENLATEMEEAELPLAYIRYGDNYINCMHGYTAPVDTTLLRDTITPIDENKKVSVVIEDKAEYVQEYSYEVRSIAGDSLIENGELEPVERTEGNKWLEIDISMDIKKNMEYMLVVKLTGHNGQVVRYYTRIVVNDDYHADELISFVDKIHASTFDFEGQKEDSPIYNFQKEYSNKEHEVIPDYGIGHVNLASPYEYITWSGLNPMVITSIMPGIKEIDVNYAVIELDYKMMTTSREDVTTYYTVKEFYQVSYGDEGINLMNFDRYVDEYFNRNEVDSLNNVYEIGIVSNPFIDYKYSSDNKKLSFVRNGQLWMYDYSKNQISLVYSFWMDDFENAANTYDNYDINIISMDDDANIVFSVYGYMNRGIHEGKIGIALYSFDSKSLELDEILFVESNVPYEVMKNQLSKLTYYDGTSFYFMLGNKVNKIDIENKQLSYVTEGVSTNSIFVSENMEVIAYGLGTTQSENDKLILTNLKTDTTYEIKSGVGECLICYGFKDSDMVYGVSDKSDTDVKKNIKTFEKTRLSDDYKDVIPAKAVYILNDSGEQIKEYKKPDYYIAQVDIETDLLYMTRCSKSGNTFTAETDDFITFKEDEKNPGIKAEFKSFEGGYVKLYFTVPTGIYLTYVPNLNITKNKIKDEIVNMVVSIPNDTANYMVYDNLGLSRIYEVAGEAINYAIEISGIVVSKNGEVIYRREVAEEYNTIAAAIFHHSSGNIAASLKDCLYMVLNYQGVDVAYDDLEESDDAVEILNLYGKYEGVDISDVDLELVLGYVGNSIPVISRISDGRYVLIVSYNSTDIRYYDPVIDEEVVKSRSAYEDMMEEGGNKLYSYVGK